MLNINDSKNLNYEAFNNAEQKTSCPVSFKAGMLSTSGIVMQELENQGFWLQFICQDLLGMTVPRTITGFNRDKDVTGKYNVQEGFEVLGREGLTGPCMMAVAPVMFLLANRLGHSTSVNTKLIKHFGNSLKDILKNANFDRTLLKNSSEFKKEFYTRNVSEILKNTLGEGKFTDANINDVIKIINKYENVPEKEAKNIIKKRKYKNNCMNEIIEYFNNILYQKKSDLNLLNKVNVSGKNSGVQTKSAIDAMIRYSDDIIKFNKDLTKLDESCAEKMMHNALGKRIIANISTIAATLGVLFVLPKIYASSSVAPGIKTAMEMDKNAKDKNPQEDNKNISFKGHQEKNIFNKIGEFFSKHAKGKIQTIASELEYEGNNFTQSLMASLSVFGLLIPRGLRAVERAPKDKDGKKDLSELHEILLRDLTSSLAVVFAVPLLTRALISSYEKHTGYVLINRDHSKKGWKLALELINPYSNSKVYTNADVNALYGGINSKEKMLNFCEFIDKNGGDLYKILKNSEHTNEIFNNSTFNLESIKNLDKKAKNKKITELFKKENIEDSVITKLMNGTNGVKKNKLLTLAKGLNSVPGMIATFIISPVILGYLIPKMTYANTRKYHEKHKQENADSINVKV